MTDIDKRERADIELDFPVSFDGRDFLSLTMRRPKVRDSLKAQKIKGSDMERGLALMADLLEEPVELLYELDEVDLEKVSEQYQRFTGRQAETQTN